MKPCECNNTYKYHFHVQNIVNTVYISICQKYCSIEINTDKTIQII